jgi:Protein of unknown function (DUF3768)
VRHEHSYRHRRPDRRAERPLPPDAVRRAGALQPGGADRGDLFACHALAAVQRFDAFTPDNDPYGEHDFVTLDGEKLFWKIDTYADGSLTHGAEDPTDPAAMRVLTIMLAEEY